MNQAQFHEFVSLVCESRLNPPVTLFSKGFDDWHCRARLAHFLAMPEFDKVNDAVDLFKSVVEAADNVNEADSEDVEEMVFAMQVLASCLKPVKDPTRPVDASAYDESLGYINQAIELAESTDFLYKYILRGELWADRWNILHMQKKTEQALEEIDEKIAVYEELKADVPHNSYLYYGYRFKAQAAGESSTLLIAKDYMYKALSFVDISDEYKEKLELAFAAEHENISWILANIDRATPAQDKCHWDI